MWGAHWSILLEKRGIPGVYIVDEPFVEDVKVTCEKEGMPFLRRVIVGHPCGRVGDEDIPRIMNEIIKGLTNPLNEEEKKEGVIKPKELPRIAITGTLSEVYEYFSKQRWTDGLPIIPPTEEKVKEMLKGTSHPPDEVITTQMPPEDLTVTVEKVAINGVMAGCKPKHMPVLLAMVEAFSEGRFGSEVRSTTSFSFMTIVNGPIRNEIGMNSGMNALGSGTRNDANAAIGRFLRLALINLGGTDTGISDMSSQGNPSKFSFAFAENEERSPWKPFHVSMGYKENESVVTIFRGGWAHAGVDGRLHIVAWHISHSEWPIGVTVLIDPLRARELASEGYTKEKIQEYLWENATTTAKNFRAPYNYTIFFKPILEGKIKRGKLYSVVSHWPKWYLDARDNKKIQIYPKKDFIYIIVVGGETIGVTTSWEMAFPSTASVDKWR